MKESLVIERIHAGLSRLRLPRIAEVLDQIVVSAEKSSKSYLSFLDDLLQEEVAQKEQRRIEASFRT